ncbi:MAG: CRISPR-associated protein Cas4 [Cetobacterium sp.]
MALKNIRQIIESRYKKEEEQKAIKLENELVNDFLGEYNGRLVDNELENRQAIPTKYYRPSSLANGCKRMLYYQRKGIDGEVRKDVNLIAICDNGTDRHERIQNIVKIMPNVSYLDIEGVLDEADDKGLDTEFIKWNEDKTEARLLNKNYGLYFQCDGLIRFKNKDIILEIKTCDMFTFNKLTQPKPEHLRQVACYSLGTGIEDVLFIYEERNFLNKKLFHIKVTDEMRKEIIDKVKDVNYFVDNNILPPTEYDKCTYCSFKKKCGEDNINGSKE